MDVIADTPTTNSYDRSFARLCEAGQSPEGATLSVIEDYLDGKPRPTGKRKITRAERDEAFWHSRVVESIPAERWAADTMILALSRYFAQERVAYPQLPDEACRRQLPGLPIPAHASVQLATGKPVFFGHYWLSGTPDLQAPHAACVDYSAGKGGALVAYRWSGESRLERRNFVSVQ